MAKLIAVETHVEHSEMSEGNDKSGEHSVSQRRPPLSNTDTRVDTGGDDQVNRRSADDRRATVDRRRSARGLFELRARRDRIVEDRRQLERRDSGRFRLAFWRRLKNT
ncbi:MAG: hypothetical protein AAF993_14960 [Pseudomonadota bacterium]